MRLDCHCSIIRLRITRIMTITTTSATSSSSRIICQYPSTAQKNLVCIECPVYINPASSTARDRIINALHGMENISKSISNPFHCLQLSFRPQDPYHHPISADQHSTNRILVSLKRRKKTNPSSSSRIKCSVVGSVQTTFTFQGMADFQYLARPSMLSSSSSTTCSKSQREMELNQFRQLVRMVSSQLKTLVVESFVLKYRYRNI